MKIYLGTDHAGFELKEKVKVFLREQGYQVEDEGAFEYKSTDDYPDYIQLVAKQVAADQDSRGIVFGYSGQGEAMAANRLKGVRAVVYYGSQPEIIKLSREHNNANVLSFGAGFVKEDEAIKAVKLWLVTVFTEEERHVRRLYKLDHFVRTENEF